MSIRGFLSNIRPGNLNNPIIKVSQGKAQSSKNRNYLGSISRGNITQRKVTPNNKEPIWASARKSVKLDGKNAEFKVKVIFTPRKTSDGNVKWEVQTKTNFSRADVAKLNNASGRETARETLQELEDRAKTQGETFIRKSFDSETLQGGSISSISSLSETWHSTQGLEFIPADSADTPPRPSNRSESTRSTARTPSIADQVSKDINQLRSTLSGAGEGKLTADDIKSFQLFFQNELGSKQQPESIKKGLEFLSLQSAKKASEEALSPITERLENVRSELAEINETGNFDQVYNELVAINSEIQGSPRIPNDSKTKLNEQVEDLAIQLKSQARTALWNEIGYEDVKEVVDLANNPTADKKVLSDKANGLKPLVENLKGYFSSSPVFSREIGELVSKLEGAEPFDDDIPVDDDFDDDINVDEDFDDGIPVDYDSDDDEDDGIDLKVVFAIKEIETDLGVSLNDLGRKIGTANADNNEGTRAELKTELNNLKAKLAQIDTSPEGYAEAKEAIEKAIGDLEENLNA